jgi:outer membrane receptor protein involved in Fe transport
MTIDVSGFYINWKDIQLLTVINGFNVNGNGGTARSDGFELAWTWEPVNRLKFSANGAYTDAQLTADVPLIGGKSGDSLPDVPKFSGNVGADYDFPVVGDINGFLGGNVQYQGKRFMDFVPLPATVTRIAMPGYTTVNLHTGMNLRGVTLEAYVKNVTNEYGFTRISSLVKDGYDAPLAAAIIQPRTFGFSVINRF